MFRHGSITTSLTNRPSTRTWSVRFCIGFCCGEHAIAPPRAVTRHQRGVSCVAGSWSPLSCSPGSTNRMTLEQLRQDDLDRWLDEEKTQRRHLVRYFLKWTAQRGLSRNLVVPTIPRQQPAKLLDDDERWQLLQRCLNDAAMPIDVRAAGALTLLFGLQTQRIRHLCAEQFAARTTTPT